MVPNAFFIITIAQVMGCFVQPEGTLMKPKDSQNCLSICWNNLALRNTFHEFMPVFMVCFEKVFRDQILFDSASCLLFLNAFYKDLSIVGDVLLPKR